MKDLPIHLFASPFTLSPEAIFRRVKPWKGDFRVKDDLSPEKRAPLTIHLERGLEGKISFSGATDKKGG